MAQTAISRRKFVKLSALTGGAMAIAACSSGEESAVAQSAVARTNDDEVMVGDVEQYALATDDWEGDYGWVRFKLHEGRHNGEPVYYIRTDASNKEFAEKEELVHVPLLAAADGLDINNIMYSFSDNRPAVIRDIPTDESYTSLFYMYEVDGAGDYDSAESIEAAAAAGDITLNDTGVFCNFPLVKWAGGELPVDTELVETLGMGPLTDLNVAQKTVTFKLHKCYPGSRYIITDTSAVPMAPMMGIVGSPVTQALKDAGGTDEIWVFANGIPGPGVMGFQPAIFDNKAGEPAWSPFWDHFTVSWNDESQATLLKSSAEIRELIDSGDLELFNGVPNSHPNGFVVNCPAPILSPNDFTVA